MQWIKASERLPDNDGLQYLRIDSESKRMGNFYESGNLIFCNVISPSLSNWQIEQTKFNGVEWLDESQTAAPSSEESNCKLSDTELLEKCDKWVTDLCRTGARAWTLSVPVNFEKDPDVLFSELAKRYKKLLASNPVAAYSEWIADQAWVLHCHHVDANFMSWVTGEDVMLKQDFIDALERLKITVANQNPLQEDKK